MSFVPGPWELLIILAIVLVIFGAGKLPKVMGDLAKGVKTFKAGLSDDEKVAAREKQEKEQIARSAAASEETGKKPEETTREPEKDKDQTAG
jgi:sec-independent protein translocase protein TatA